MLEWETTNAECFSPFLNNTNGTKSHKTSHLKKGISDVLADNFLLFMREKQLRILLNSEITTYAQE